LPVAALAAPACVTSSVADPLHHRSTFALRVAEGVGQPDGGGRLDHLRVQTGVGECRIRCRAQHGGFKTPLAYGIQCRLQEGGITVPVAAVGIGTQSGLCHLAVCADIDFHADFDGMQASAQPLRRIHGKHNGFVLSGEDESLGGSMFHLGGARRRKHDFHADAADMRCVACRRGLCGPAPAHADCPHERCDDDQTGSGCSHCASPCA
jgi:hypothetical protein